MQENAGPPVSVDPSQNAGALVLRGADLQALSDDPDDLQADLQALAGPSAGPSGGQIYIDGFTGGTLPSKDSIREIRINQNPFSPEYDKLGYGRIEILTKPGTDKLHGNVNFDFGDAIFDSRNPYAAAESAVLCSGISAAPSAARWARRRLSSWMFRIATSTTETSSTASRGNHAPAFPAAPFNSVFSAPQNRFRISPRIDYQLSTEQHADHALWLHPQRPGQIRAWAISVSCPRGYHALDTDHTVQIIETAVLSTKVINETHFQLYHTESDQMADSPICPVSSWPARSMAAALRSERTTDTENHYELQNYTTVSGGAHTWKFGVRVRAVTINNFSPHEFRRNLHFQRRLRARSSTAAISR